MASKQSDINAELFSRLRAIEEKTSTQPPVDEPDFHSLAIWLPEAFHEPGTIGGIVVDEGLARESDCRCIPLGEHSHLCYKKGVVGALSQVQEKFYCLNPQTMELSPELVERQRIMRDSAVVCQEFIQGLPEIERLESFMQCLTKTAKSKGVNL